MTRKEEELRRAQEGAVCVIEHERVAVEVSDEEAKRRRVAEDSRQESIGDKEQLEKQKKEEVEWRKEEDQ